MMLPNFVHNVHNGLLSLAFYDWYFLNKLVLWCNTTHLVAVCLAGYGKRWLSACSSCQKGFYKDKIGFGECTKCPAGKTTSRMASTKESDCGKGFYLITNIDPQYFPRSLAICLQKGSLKRFIYGNVYNDLLKRDFQ